MRTTACKFVRGERSHVTRNRPLIWKVAGIGMLLSTALTLSLTARPAAAVVGDAADATLDATAAVIKLAGDAVGATVDATGSVIDASGNVVGKVFVGSDKDGDKTVIRIETTDGSVLNSTLVNRRDQIEDTISTQVAAGTLTTEEASEFRDKLKEIDEQRAEAMDSGDKLTFEEGLKVAQKLDELYVNVRSAAAMPAPTPLVILDDEGNKRILVITRKVATTAGGATTVTTTTTTRTITEAPTAVIVPSPEARETLANILETRRLEIDRMISRNASAGTISSSQALTFKSDLDVLSREIIAAEAANSLSGAKALDLAHRLDALGTRVAVAAQVNAPAALVVMDPATGTERIVANVFEDVKLLTVKPGVFVSTFQSKSTLLERLIAHGQATGAMTDAQAAHFRAELDRLARMQQEAQASGLTFVTALPIALEYDILGTQITAIVPTPEVRPLVVGRRFLLNGEFVIKLDDVMVRRAELEGRISRELAQGNISASQAADLRSRLNEVAEMETAYRADGELDFTESRRLYTSFDRIGSRLDEAVAAR